MSSSIPDAKDVSFREMAANKCSRFEMTANPVKISKVSLPPSYLSMEMFLHLEPNVMAYEQGLHESSQTSYKPQQ
eukprot:g78828.t1